MEQLFVLGTFGWILKGRKLEAELWEGGWIMKHTFRTRPAAWGLAIIVLLMLLFSIFFLRLPSKDPGFKLWIIWIACLSICLVLVMCGLWSVYTDRVFFNKDYVLIQHFLRRRKHIPWSEIDALRYSQYWNVIKIILKNGRSAWMDVTYDGLGTFHQFLSQYQVKVDCGYPYFPAFG